MRELLFVLFLTISLLSNGQDLMTLQPSGHINDFEQIFTSEQNADLENICSDYEKKTSIEICLVTSADFNLDLSDDLGNKWGIGKKGLDNGLLIVLSKAQRDCAIRTGYGLEPFLPDATLTQYTDEIYPRTLSNDSLKDRFYIGMKELILTCQKHLGNQSYDFLVEYKKLQEKRESEAQTAALYEFIKIILLLIILGGIGFLIYRHIQKLKKLRELKNSIETTAKVIEEFKSEVEKFGPLPKELQDIYDTKIEPTKSNITQETFTQNQYIYNQFIDYRAIINTINNAIVSISSVNSDVEKYLQDNYPYCEEYLKNELSSISFVGPDFEDLKTGEYRRERMNKLVGIQTSLDGKLKAFLNKTVKINSIITDNLEISKKTSELKNSFVEYTEKRTILSSVKIGKRYDSLVNIDFDNYLNKITTNISSSLNFLKNEDFDSAMNTYGNYVTTISVLSSAFESVTSLLNQFNKSEKSIKENTSKLSNFISSIEGKINHSGVSYTRKSTYEDIKSNISKYKISLTSDIIQASDMLSKIIKLLDELENEIDSDISDHESNLRAAAAATALSSSSRSSSNGGGFGGFGGGSFGGGGTRSKF